MQEHESSARLFAGSIVDLPSMTAAEQVEIVRIAETRIHRAIRFDDEATMRLVDLADGHPYLIHLIGKYALRNAHTLGAATISGDDIDNALRVIAEGAHDPTLEGRYRKAVAASTQRESVLKAMAETVAQDGEVHTTTAYKRCLDDGVENPSQYVGQLVSPEYGSELLIKVRERFYRFRDSLFRAYVDARPRLFAEAD